jgi:hypothetical protein
MDQCMSENGVFVIESAREAQRLSVKQFIYYTISHMFKYIPGVIL